MERHRDDHIVCASCGTSFLFSAAEAAVYAERSLAAPKRCRECRRARKEQGGGRRAGPQDARGPQAQGNTQPHAGDAQRRPARGGAQPQRPRYTGDVNEYRSPMQDAYSGAGYGWPAQQQAQGAGRPRRPRPQDDGNYRAPSFGGERAAPQARGAAAGPRPQRTRATFAITCKSCGAESEVPFKPIEGRDVFCQACYRARKPS